MQLTSRRTNIAYQGQQINQQRLSLSNSSAGLFEKMLSLAVPTPPSSQDDKYYTQGYNFVDSKDGIQKKIYWQTYADAIASGAPDAASYYAPATGLTIRSTRDGTNQNFDASIIANPTEDQKKQILEALGIHYTAVTQTAPVAPPPAITYDAAHTITSAAEFISKISADLAGDFIIENDLDFSSINLTQAAITGNFTGSLDGNGKTIDALTINNNAFNARAMGLFERINGGSVKDLQLTNTSITLGGGANLSVGALSGGSSNAVVDNVVATNTNIVVGDNSSAIGGLIGNVSGGIIQNSYSDASISGTNQGSSIGGLIGYGTSGISIEQSWASGDIDLGNGATTSGGLVGFLNNGNISNSYTTVNLNLGNNAGFSSSSPAVDSSWGIGGFVGQIVTGSISNSYAANSIMTLAGASHIGGFVGYTNGGTIDNTNFYDVTLNSRASTGSISSGMSNAVALTTSDIADMDFPINTWSTSIWNTSGAYPVFGGSGATNSEETLESARQEIRYATIEYTKYTPDGQLQQEKRQEIMVLEFDNLNRLLRTTSLTDKNYIDATQNASADNAPEKIGDGDKLTYVGNFDLKAYQNDINKYEFEKAAYDSQVERINQGIEHIYSQDKSLEIKLKQLDTEYNAVQTEIDAVQKVIQKNAESSFKIFA